jgi:hypothetical protein
MVSKKSDLLICDDYLQFQNHLKELRKLDDLIINTLNSGSVASKQCQKLGDEVIDNFHGFHFFLSISIIRFFHGYPIGLN